MIWNRTKECMDRVELEKMQSARLVKLAENLYHNVPYYREKMQEAGLNPSSIKGIEDIKKLPFTVKDDLRDTFPTGLFAKPITEIVRLHASSGTTGKPTVVGYTRRDIEIWSECVSRCLTMAGIGKDDIIQVAYGYGLFTGGLGVHYGGEYVGATVIPMSTSGTKQQIAMMMDLDCTAIACTPSYLMYIMEDLEKGGLIDKINLKAAICGAEPWTDEMRASIEEKMGIVCLDIYGLSEIMGPGVACDCKYHKGLHIFEDHFFPEILDPDTLEPVPEGEVGELVITTLTKEAIPLIRYRTGDLTRINYDPCECGRTMARMDKFLGRSDDMLVIRGVNLFPSQVEAALYDIGIESPYYQLVVDRVDNLDRLTLRLEMDDTIISDEIKVIESHRKRIIKGLRDAIGLRVELQLVEPRAIERTAGKSKKVIDNRVL